jgi:NADH dehydrogenase
MPGWGRRLKVASSWTLDLLLPAELVQLKVSGNYAITHEHFEAGQDVFHQGDLGDRVYVILTGAAEVWQKADGRLRPLARLGPGDWFGEMALLNQTTRGATVRCVEAMDALSLPKRDFTVLAANLPELRESFERVMAARRAVPSRKDDPVPVGR